MAVSWWDAGVGGLRITWTTRPRGDVPCGLAAAGQETCSPAPDPPVVTLLAWRGVRSRDAWRGYSLLPVQSRTAQRGDHAMSEASKPKIENLKTPSQALPTRLGDLPGSEAELSHEEAAGVRGGTCTSALDEVIKATGQAITQAARKG